MIEYSVVIANYNNPNLIGACLESIDKFLFVPGLEVVVVDNGSVDQEFDHLKSRYPYLVVRYLSSNRGFGYAINKGVEIARGKTILILNSDVEIMDSSLQKLMFEFGMLTEPALWSPYLRSLDGTEYRTSLRALRRWRFWFWFSTYGEIRRYKEGARALPRSSVKADEQANYLYATCLLVRTSDFVALGGFDEKYFLYFEDMDFCDRFRRMFGPDIWLKNNCNIVHHVKGSSKSTLTTMWQFERSKYIYAYENFGLGFVVMWLIFDSPLRLCFVLVSALVNSLRNLRLSSS